ncbi:MAG: hypothetical protein ABFS19_09445 [Thermodesulfobacteriota bacterium]
MENSRYSQLPSLLIYSLIVCFLLFSPGVDKSSADTFFLTLDEARELSLTDAEWDMPPMLTRGVSLGPVIDFQSPVLSNDSNPTLEAASPLSLVVMFRENQAPVDMNSLEITAKKGFFSKSLTDRVKPFVEGTALKASGLKIPEGKFKIEVAITDVKGNQTSVEYRLVVKN